MTHAQRGVRVPCATARRKIWLLCFASILGTGVLAAASIAQAHYANHNPDKRHGIRRVFISRCRSV